LIKLLPSVFFEVFFPTKGCVGMDKEVIENEGRKIRFIQKFKSGGLQE
jgi:hypothetical protein